MEKQDVADESTEYQQPQQPEQQQQTLLQEHLEQSTADDKGNATKQIQC